MSIVSESRRTLVLAFPIIVGQLSQMLLGMADSLMIGHLGVTDLAALTFANALFSIPFVGGIGILTGVSVMTANSKGAGDITAVRASCQNGLFIALSLGALLFGISWVLSVHLESLGQPAEVAERTVWFFRIIMFSIIPGLGSIALKNHADALNRPWPPFWFSISGGCINIILNFALIFGLWGFPNMGMEGAAVATLIGRILIFATTFIWLVKSESIKELVPRSWFNPPDFSAIRRLLQIGFPASLGFLCEVGAFSAAGLAMGKFGESAMAAHQISLTCAGTVFMIPLGLSMALTIRTGEANGLGEFGRLKPIILSGWFIASAFAVTGILFFSFFGRQISWLFIRDEEVIGLTASLLIIVGVFQLTDGLQVASAGMLRGLQDAKVPAIMGFASYWLVGLPFGLWLALSMNLGARGVWWGLAAGLTVAAFTLGPRLWYRAQRISGESKTIHTQVG